MRLRRRPQYSIKLEVYANGSTRKEGGELGLAYQGTVSYSWALNFITTFFDTLGDTKSRGVLDLVCLQYVDYEMIEIIDDTNVFRTWLACDKHPKDRYLPPGMVATQKKLTYPSNWRYVFTPGDAPSTDSRFGRLCRLSLSLAYSYWMCYPSTFTEQVRHEAQRHYDAPYK